MSDNCLRFNIDDAQKAGDEWAFNCGPGALCAVLNMTPNEIRPHLVDFEKRRYTNPRLMRQILDGLKIKYEWHVAPYTLPPMPIWLHGSLVRVQWGGPWTDAGAHFMARQRHTHWIACRWQYRDGIDRGYAEIFDINAMCVGGWMEVSEWKDQLVPWLLKECEPKANGEWWQTHIATVTP